jgi:hypothetical protein
LKNNRVTVSKMKPPPAARPARKWSTRENKAGSRKITASQAGKKIRNCLVSLIQTKTNSTSYFVRKGATSQAASRQDEVEPHASLPLAGGAKGLHH